MRNNLGHEKNKTFKKRGKQEEKCDNVNNKREQMENEDNKRKKEKRDNRGDNEKEQLRK